MVELASAATGLTAAGFLAMLYVTIQQQWPESYYSVESSIDPVVSKHMHRYILTRLGPTYLASVAVVTTIERFEGRGSIGLLWMVGVHIATTNGKGLVEQLRDSTAASAIFRRNAILFHAVVIVGLGFVASIGFVSARWLAGLVPNPREVSAGIWTAIMAAILAGFLQRLTIGSGSRGPMLAHAKGRVSSALIAYGRETAVARGSDPDLIEAIMLAEALQRPRWFRRVERIKGFFLRPGTYGVMQVYADRPISDRESIDRVIKDCYPGHQVPKNSYGYARQSMLERAIEKHNSSPGFVTMASGFYRELQPIVVMRSDASCHVDGRSAIEVTKVERRGESWHVRGTFCGKGPLLCINLPMTESDWFERKERTHVIARTAWQKELPIEALRLYVVDLGGFAEQERSKSLWERSKGRLWGLVVRSSGAAEVAKMISGEHAVTVDLSNY